jgi:Kef-type K+ transport system, predicted NAD-binding component
MPHDVTLISTIAIGFVLAFAFGYAAQRFRLPPLVGYALAGIVIGPFTPGFVADPAITGQLAEIGVMLLMFGVGLHFSLADLLAVRRIAVPGAILQIVLATLLGIALTHFWGWSLGAGLVLGLSLSVASTVVLLKALEERNAVSTPNGRVAVGWLIVEDLAMVLALVLLPAFAPVLGGTVPDDGHGPAHASLLANLGNTAIKVSTFVLIVLFFGPRVMPWLLRQVARTGSRELFTLCVLAVSLGIAFGSAKLFDVSFALGAFFAGVVLSESDLSHRAAENSLPLQDAFAVLFFVSVGVLFDPSILLNQPGHVAAVVALIIVGKAIIALGIVLALGYPIHTGLIAAASLAQIGEFSFILAGLGLSYQLLPAEGLSLVLAGALLSITLNPLAFACVDRLSPWLASLGGPRWKTLYSEGRAGHFARFQNDLEAARRLAAEKAAEHKTFSPEELVRQFPLFATLTADQRDVLLLHFETYRAKPGERVIRAGDHADSVYFICSGEVEVVPPGRKENIKLGPGAFFGEMALLNGGTRSADVIALDYSKFLTLTRRDFLRFLKRYPALRAPIVALAQERGAMNRKLLEDLDPAEPSAPVPSH